MLDYIRDGQEIYRNSFAIIRAEANLARIPADLEKLAVRVIHACGMVDAIDGLQFSEGAGKAGRAALAAGAPILAQEHVEESCNINPTFFHPRADYLLRVHGMSMKDVGIFDGDLLAVHTTREARNGQIVVARIGDEVTVKRFKREGSKVWLLAENPEFAPIEVNLKDQDLVIEGLSVGVIRR